jgi:hypothetical protein
MQITALAKTVLIERLLVQEQRAAHAHAVAAVAKSGKRGRSAARRAERGQGIYRAVA